MKASRAIVWSAVIGLSIAPMLAVAPQANAADAKARCRVGVNPSRVQISVGANNLAAGPADFQVTAGGNVSSTLTSKVDPLGDAAAEWDSAIAAGDPAEGTRGSISANFVGRGLIVTATVKQGGGVVATASATCGAK